jgi:hypothetical protein
MPTLSEILEEMRPIMKSCIAKGFSKEQTLNAVHHIMPYEIQGEYRRQTIEAAERLYDEMSHSP